MSEALGDSKGLSEPQVLHRYNVETTNAQHRIIVNAQILLP